MRRKNKVVQIDTFTPVATIAIAPDTMNEEEAEVTIGDCGRLMW